MNETKETSGQPDQNASGVDQETGSSDSVSAAESALQAHNRKILTELKNERNKRRETELTLQKIEEEKLLTQNQFKELAEKRAKEAADAKAELEKMKKTILYDKFKDAVRTEAVNMGVPSNAVNALIKSGDWSDVEVDQETFEVNGDQLKAALAKMQKEQDFFFVKSAKGVKDVQPGNGIPVGKPLNEMSREELSLLAKNYK